MRSWLKNTSRLVLIFLIVFLCWHYFKKSPSLIRQIKDKSVVLASLDDSDNDPIPDNPDGDSDSVIEPEYKEIPYSPTDPDWLQFQADAANAEDDPSKCTDKCSYWNEYSELVVKDEGGNVIRVWQPYEGYEDPSERDSVDSSDSVTPCTLYCPASTAPACGGSCSGCYQEVPCDEGSCDKPGCSCQCYGPPDDRYCAVSGSYCAVQCSEWRPDECPTNGCQLVGAPPSNTCMTPCISDVGYTCRLPVPPGTGYFCLNHCGTPICCTPSVTATPTPTPTPTPPLRWTKLKNASFSSLGSLTNGIPLNITPYDSEDTTDRYFIITNSNNDPGLATALSFNTYGSDISLKKWQVANYTRARSLFPQTFLSYVKSRKNSPTMSDLSSIQQDGIYLWQGNLTLNNNSLNQISASRFVLIVDGQVDIEGERFNIGDNCIDVSTSKSAAILSTQTLSFSDNTQCAAGVFVGQTVNIGSTTNQGLKIKGNLALDAGRLCVVVAAV